METHFSFRQTLQRLPVIGSLWALAYLLLRPRHLIDRLQRLEEADHQRPAQDRIRDEQLQSELLAQVRQLRAERENHVAWALEQARAELLAQVGQLRAERENHVAWALEQARVEREAHVAAALQQARAEREADVGRLQAGLERQAHNLTQLTDVQAGILELEQVKRGVGELAGQLQALAHHLERELNQVKWLADAKANGGEVRVIQDQIKHDLLPMRQQLRDYRRSLVDQERRLGRLLAEVRQRQPAPLDAAQTAALVQADDHRLDALYVSFEDHFRGPRAEIQQRLQSYVPYLRQAGVGGETDPILDIGCGRGEWLELLIQQGLMARGIDLNQAMVAECRERGLMVEAAEALAGLRGLPDASLGAVTGFHVIEHLPLETLVSLLDEALRVVRPGGLLILETPNPENLMVSGYNFHFDPTHRRPLPPLLTQFLLEGRGWTPVEILRLNAYPDDLRFTVDNSNLQIASWLNQVFCGPQDYAVIGHKP